MSKGPSRGPRYIHHSLLLDEEPIDIDAYEREQLKEITGKYLTLLAAETARSAKDDDDA